MDTRLNVEWKKCVNCGKDFPRRKKTGSPRHSGRKGINIRPATSRTCSRKCSRDWTHKLNNTPKQRMLLLQSVTF